MAGYIKTIKIEDLVCMDDYADTYHYAVDLAYARADNILFREQVYKSDAKLWLHKDLAEIVFEAAQTCYEEHGMRFVLYDGLRTIEAQESMSQTQRVRDNPSWLEPPRMVSRPGKGGHPRGMAIDVGLMADDGSLLNMGCAFDTISEHTDEVRNLAHRKHAHTDDILANREILNQSLLNAAKNQDKSLHMLRAEWWDFRLPLSVYREYQPVSEADLPEHMKLIENPDSTICISNSYDI